jgi:hypothetical protein
MLAKLLRDYKRAQTKSIVKIRQEDYAREGLTG